MDGAVLYVEKKKQKENTHLLWCGARSQASEMKNNGKAANSRRWKNRRNGETKKRKTKTPSQPGAL